MEEAPGDRVPEPAREEGKVPEDRVVVVAAPARAVSVFALHAAKRLPIKRGYPAMSKSARNAAPP